MVAIRSNVFSCRFVRSGLGVLAHYAGRRQRLGRVGLALAAFMAGAAPALALDNDWIANINDSGSDPTPAGGVVTYNISVTNSGADAAAATTVTLQIPATMTFIGSSGTITGCAPVPATGPGNVVCTVPPLASSGAATLAAQVRSSAQGSVTMGAAVSTAGDSDPANNDVTEITTITAGADVSLGLSGPATASAGGTVTYVFTATNNGPNTVSSLVLSFPAPSGLTNITPPPGCTLSAGTYSCSVPGPIAVGASVTRNLTGQISASTGSTVTIAGSIGASVP